MPISSDIILDWIAEDGYSLSEAGWIHPSSTWALERCDDGKLSRSHHRERRGRGCETKGMGGMKCQECGAKTNFENEDGVRSACGLCDECAKCEICGGTNNISKRESGREFDETGHMVDTYVWVCSHCITATPEPPIQHAPESPEVRKWSPAGSGGCCAVFAFAVCVTWLDVAPEPAFVVSGIVFVVAFLFFRGISGKS